MFDGIILSEIIATIVYTILALGLFVFCFWVIEMITVFVSIKKELIEKQNTAVAILLGSGAIAMAIIM